MSTFHNVLVLSKEGNYTTDLDNCHELDEQYNRNTFRYITKSPTGKYVIVHESVYEDDEITAYEVSNKTALDDILESNRYWILDDKQFVDLKELCDKEIVKEDTTSKSCGVVPVYKHGKLYATVQTNNLLDEPPYTTHHHTGLTKLTTGEYVLTHSEDDNRNANIAFLVEPKIALQYIITSYNKYLLDDPEFKDLKELYDNK